MEIFICGFGGDRKPEPPTVPRQGRSRISLDHFDRAGSPLCVYYVFIMAGLPGTERQNQRRPRPFALVRDPRSTYRSPYLDSLIDTVMLGPADHGGPGCL